MFRPITTTLSLFVLFALTGCAEQGDSTKMTDAKLTPTELAAYAASHPYPTGRATDEMHIAAMVNADRSQIKLYNFSNTPLSEVDVWVNGSWVQHVRGIGANGSVALRTTDLYNAFGKNFSSQSEPVSRVQINTGDHFYNAMGPVTQ